MASVGSRWSVRGRLEEYNTLHSAFPRTRAALPLPTVLDVSLWDGEGPSTPRKEYG